MSISFDAAAVGERVHGFEPAEGDGQRGVHRGAGDRPGRYVDAAGDVDGDHRDPVGVDRGEHLGRRRSQRPRAGDAHHPVDDQIGCRRNPVDDAAAGLPERRQPLAVGVVGIEQHRVGGSAATAHERRRPQRVAAVVSRADDRAHPAAGDPAGAGGQLADDLGGQPEGRAPHQGAVGQAGQQRRFGVADRVHGVVMPHHRQHSMLAAFPYRAHSSVSSALRLHATWRRDMARTDDDTWDLATSVGATATGVAVVRALASRDDNPLIHDPFAAPLVRAVGVTSSPAWPTASWIPTQVDATRVGDGANARHAGCRAPDSSISSCGDQRASARR